MEQAYCSINRSDKAAGGSALTIAASLAADPWSLFLFAMKSSMTREKYRGRLVKFFDFVGVEGTSMPERARTFVKISKNDRARLFDTILQFAQMQRERVERKEISLGTLGNYIKALKLFCE